MSHHSQPPIFVLIPPGNEMRRISDLPEYVMPRNGSAGCLADYIACAQLDPNFSKATKTGREALRHSHLAVYKLLLGFYKKNRSRTFEVHNETIMTRTGKSRSTVIAVMNDLEDAGYVDTLRQGGKKGNDANLYRIHTPMYYEHWLRKEKKPKEQQIVIAKRVLLKHKVLDTQTFDEAVAKTKVKQLIVSATSTNTGGLQAAREMHKIQQLVSRNGFSESDFFA